MQVDFAKRLRERLGPNDEPLTSLIGTFETTIDQAADEIDRLWEDGSKLSAGQCVKGDGIMMGEYGHPTCPLVFFHKTYEDGVQAGIAEERARWTE